jgi:hypothetical protein
MNIQKQHQCRMRVHSCVAHPHPTLPFPPKFDFPSMRLPSRQKISSSCHLLDTSLLLSHCFHYGINNLTPYLALSSNYPLDIFIDARDQEWDFSEAEYVRISMSGSWWLIIATRMPSLFHNPPQPCRAIELPRSCDNYDATTTCSSTFDIATQIPPSRSRGNDDAAAAHSPMYHLSQSKTNSPLKRTTPPLNGLSR